MARKFPCVRLTFEMRSSYSSQWVKKKYHLRSFMQWNGLERIDYNDRYSHRLFANHTELVSYGYATFTPRKVLFSRLVSQRSNSSGIIPEAEWKLLLSCIAIRFHLVFNQQYVQLYCRLNSIKTLIKPGLTTPLKLTEKNCWYKRSSPTCIVARCFCQDEPRNQPRCGIGRVSQQLFEKSWLSDRLCNLQWEGIVSTLLHVMSQYLLLSTTFQITFIPVMTIRISGRISSREVSLGIVFVILSINLIFLRIAVVFPWFLNCNNFRSFSPLHSFPTGPIVVPANSRVIIHSGCGLLHGGTVRREIVEVMNLNTENHRSELKLLQYKFRMSSVTLQGPMNVLQVMQVCKFQCILANSTELKNVVVFHGFKTLWYPYGRRFHNMSGMRWLETMCFQRSVLFLRLCIAFAGLYWCLWRQILAQSVLTTSNQDHVDNEPNWRRCRFSIRQKQAFCFDVDSSHSVDIIPELNCVPDPSKPISVTEIDQAAEEAMDRCASESMVFPKKIKTMSSPFLKMVSLYLYCPIMTLYTVTVSYYSSRIFN